MTTAPTMMSKINCENPFWFTTIIVHLNYICHDLAGPQGFEPWSSVLETEILPLNYRPNVGLRARQFEYIVPAESVRLLLRFLMLRMSSAPLTVLLQFNFACHKLAVLARPIVNTATLGTGKFKELILRHIQLVPKTISH